jgi:hypothetical protein
MANQIEAPEARRRADGKKKKKRRGPHLVDQKSKRVIIK